MTRFSSNIAALQPSATIAVSSRVKQLISEGRDVLNLCAGEPDFDTPGFILDAAEHAMRNGATHYTATEGILPLREAIAADANLLLQGAPVTPSEIVVSNGSKQSPYNACMCCFGPGDEVLIPTPSWTSYYEMIELARAAAVPVYGDAANSLKVTAKNLERAATPRTRGIMLNSPSNPTGAVYTRSELEDILSLAASRNWWVIADEIYRRISYDGVAHSMLELTDNRSNLIVINGVAKAYAMTGWRILVVDDEASLRHTLELILRDEGCDVLTAADGEDGLRLASDPEVVRTWQQNARDRAVFYQRERVVDEFERTIHRILEREPLADSAVLG